MKLLLVLLLIAVTLPSHAQRQQADLKHLLQQAEAARSGNPDNAFSMYEHVVERGDPLTGYYYVSMVSLTSLARTSAQRETVRRYIFKGMPTLLTAQPDSSVATVLFKFGEFYDESESMADSAIICYSHALKIRTALSGEQSEPVAACWDGMGTVYKYVTYDFNAAEKAFEKALQIRESLGSTDPNVQASSYYNLAVTNRSQRDFERALDYLFKYISIGESRHDARMLEVAYTSLGNTYRDLHQLDKAYASFTRAIHLNLTNPNLPKENLATNYQNRGSAQMLEGKYQEALSSFRLAFSIYDKLDRKDMLYVNAIEQMGVTYMKMGDLESAIEKFHQAERTLAFMHATGGGQQAGVLRNIAEYFLKKMMTDSSLVYCQRSLQAAVPGFTSDNTSENPVFSQIELKETVFETLLVKAKALQSKSEADNQGPIRSCLILAEQILSYSRSALDMDQSKWSYAESEWAQEDSKFAVYEQLVSQLLQQSKHAQEDTLISLSFHFMEKSKSKRLADALSQAGDFNPEMANDSLVATLTKLKSDVFTVSAELKRPLPEDSIGKIRTTLANLDRKIKVNEELIRKKYPSYLKIRFDTSIPSLKSLQTQLKARGSVWIEYLWGYRELYAMGISADHVIFASLGRTDTIRNIIGKLNMHFDGSKTMIPLDYSEVAHELFQKLLFPFEPLISKSDRLIIVPDGWISKVPFEALTTTKERNEGKGFQLPYLIRTHTIAYAFSAATFFSAETNRVQNPKMLAFGYGGGGGAPSAQTLAGSVLEIGALKKVFADGEYFENEEATESQFKTLASDYDILHMAVHGNADSTREFSARLLFASNVDHDDGSLYWYELYPMRLKASLAVLTACESGVGKDYRGEGMMSMATAFAYAGCQNVVMGLWRVGDRATADIMNPFYQKLIEGSALDMSLASAKRNYLDQADGLTSDPRFWSSLVPYGDTSVVIRKDRSTLLIAGLIGLMLLSVFFGFKRRMKT